MNIRFRHILLASICVLALASCHKKEKPADQVQDTTPAFVIVDEPVDSTPAIDTNLAKEIKAENNLQTGTFYVIGGSFKEIARAEKFNKQLLKKGYNSQILKPHNDFNRVAIKSATTSADARVELEKLRKDFGDISFWMLVP
jgi:cell division protein FtsN